MQSTGMPGHIQMTTETATLLEQSGSKTVKYLLTPRDEKVIAKGKGELSTVWLSTVQFSSTSGSSMALSLTGEGGQNPLEGSKLEAFDELSEGDASSHNEGLSECAIE